MEKKLIYCNCGANIISPQVIEEIEREISECAIDSVKLTDLCGLCANQKEEVKNIFSGEDEVTVLACYPRSVKLLLNFAGVKDTSNITVVNLREAQSLSISEILASFQQNKAENKESKNNIEWPSWYPIIDYSRCSSCGQCADFCLFGVYEKNEGKVLVVNPQGCKNNCPACARICPQTAIVFPKYQHGGAIAGSEVINQIAEQERQRKDMDEILGSDIYQALEQRKLKRQALVKAEAMNRAIEEREKALKETSR
jgi:NAD-dependent dihydropyrimidine dehydrogenase PreA subunit